MQRLKVECLLLLNMNQIDDYMGLVDETLKNTTDPFAKKHAAVIKSLIKMVATDNWINYGEPMLTKEQMDWVYDETKRKTKDRAWEIVGPFNICMN